MEYIHLIGAEQVQTAGYSIGDAAEEMNRAANTISEALWQHRIFMDEWLERFERIMTAANGGK